MQKNPKKTPIEVFLKQPQDSNTIVTINGNELFIYIKDDLKEMLKILDTKKQNNNKDKSCTEE